MKERNFLQKGIWKTKGRKGFTLGEVLLTVAILAILTATAVPAVGYFSRLLNQMKLDNTAREIFISAQNKMVTMKSCGMELPEGTSMGVTPPTDYDTGDWLNKGAEDTIHPFRYISSKDATFMQDTLLAKDKQEGQYVIEYNRSTGNVYAVFYWEPQEVDFGGKSSFAYAEKNNEPGVRGDRKARMNSSLKVGYYGGNVAAMTEAEELVYDAKIINEDKLQLWLMAEDKTIGENTRYVITLRSATDTENTAEYTFGVQYKDGQEKSVTFNNGTATESLLEDNVEALDDVTKKEHGFLITLDSVEANQHFANLFPKIAAGDDISIKVQAYYLGTDKVCIAKRNFEMTQNSLFARVRQEEASGKATSGGAIKRNPKGTDVVITTGRHLQNLSVEASHLGYTSEGTAEKTKYPIVNAKLNANIDWQKKVDETKNYYENNNTLYSNSTLLNSFQPISIDEKSNLKKIEGNERSISYLQITKGGGTGAGLFGVVSKELTIENLKMKDCVVNTENVGNVGMLIGQVNAQPAKKVTITGCGTYLSTEKEYKTDEYHVKNTGESGAIGGFVGGLKNGTLTIQDSFSAVNIGGEGTAFMNVGGLVGLADGGSLTMNNSYTSCVVDAKGKTGAYAGGLAGKVTATLTANDCFTTCDVSAKADAKGYSGGAFGYLNNGNLNDILSYGRVTWNGGTSEQEKDFSGGFVGKNEGGVVFSECYYLSMKEYNVTGNDIATWKSHKELRLKEPLPEYQKKLTHAYNADLKDAAFPFPLRKKADGKELLPYYGNWPADLGDRESVLGLCYYEKYAEGDYGVFISGMNMYDTDEAVYVDMLDYDPKSKKRVQNFGYCIAAKNVVTKYKESALPLKAEDYTFYDLPMESIKDFEKGTRKIELKGHLKGKPEAESLTKDFYYHPDFAAAISMGGLTNGKYASALESYQVRCMKQLKKVENVEYAGYAFSQTANFSTGVLKSDSVVAFLPTGASYDGRAKHLKSELPSQAYTIDVRITQTATTANEGTRVVGLFGTNKGTLKNLNVTGGIEIYYLSADGFQAGTLTGRNEGTVENCVSQTSLVFKNPGEAGTYRVGEARIGGLIGENAAGASCKFSRVEGAKLLSKSRLMNETTAEVYIGGLIGLSDGTCEFNQVRGSAVVCQEKETEKETTVDVKCNPFIGGVIGCAKNEITGCQAIDVTLCKDANFNTAIGFKPTIGGFVGKVSTNDMQKKISYCAYYGDVYIPDHFYNYDAVGQFVGRIEDDSSFVSCYGWKTNPAGGPTYFKGNNGERFTYEKCYCKGVWYPGIPSGMTYTVSISTVQNGLNAPGGWKWELQDKALVLVKTP